MIWKLAFVSIALGMLSCSYVIPRPAPASILIDYSPEFQSKAAQELGAIKGTAPNISQMIVDYGKLRAAIRAGSK